jgi:hypothetical protein
MALAADTNCRAGSGYGNLQQSARLFPPRKFIAFMILEFRPDGLRRLVEMTTKAPVRPSDNLRPQLRVALLEVINHSAEDRELNITLNPEHRRNSVRPKQALFDAPE